MSSVSSLPQDRNVRIKEAARTSMTNKAGKLGRRKPKPCVRQARHQVRAKEEEKVKVKDQRRKRERSQHSGLSGEPKEKAKAVAEVAAHALEA